MRNISCLRAICWDYNINEDDVIKILLDKTINNYPIDKETLRYKLLRYIKLESIKKVFSDSEFYAIYHNINIKKIRNRTAQRDIPLLLAQCEKNIIVAE